MSAWHTYLQQPENEFLFSPAVLIFLGMFAIVSIAAQVIGLKVACRWVAGRNIRWNTAIALTMFQWLLMLSFQGVMLSLPYFEFGMLALFCYGIVHVAILKWFYGCGYVMTVVAETVRGCVAAAVWIPLLIVLAFPAYQYVAKPYRVEIGRLAAMANAHRGGASVELDFGGFSAGDAGQESPVRLVGLDELGDLSGDDASGRDLGEALSAASDGLTGAAGLGRDRPVGGTDRSVGGTKRPVGGTERPGDGTERSVRGGRTGLATGDVFAPHRQGAGGVQSNPFFVD